MFEDEGQVEEEDYEASEEEAQEDEAEIEVKRLCIFQFIYHDLFWNILIGFWMNALKYMLILLHI